MPKLHEFGSNPAHSTDSDTVTLVLPDTGDEIKLWTSYSYAQEFLTPTDAFSFTIGDAATIARYRPLLVPGRKVSLVVGDRVQASGYVYKLHTQGARSATTLTVSGRDTLSPMVDGGIDPDFSLGDGTTLNDVVARVAKAYGFQTISTTDIANRSVVTGNKAANVVKTGTTYTSNAPRLVSNGTETKLEDHIETSTIFTETDPTRPKFLKDIAIKQVKPHANEGSFEFLARLCKRFKLWLWCNALGDTLIVDIPDFDQRSTYELRRKADGGNNVLDGFADVDATDQPSIIIAAGFGGGQQFAHSNLHVAMVNELTGVDSKGALLPEVQRLINGYKGIRLLDVRSDIVPFAPLFALPLPRPMFVADDESKTLDQLEGYVRAEMGKAQAKALAVEYVVRGHTQGGIPWAVNTIVDVDDDVLNIHEPMWIRGRTFSKGPRPSGTMTRLSLVPLHMMEIS